MLKKGQKFTIGNAKWKVAYVNNSRAHCTSENTHEVTVTDKATGEPRSFMAHSTATMDISPNSDVDVMMDLLKPKVRA
jgi:hypothetical protein